MKAMQTQMELGKTESRPNRDHNDFITGWFSRSPTGRDRLMETICERENLREALKRVERNKGAPGIDRRVSGLGL